MQRCFYILAAAVEKPGTWASFSKIGRAEGSHVPSSLLLSYKVAPFGDLIVMELMGHAGCFAASLRG